MGNREKIELSYTKYVRLDLKVGFGLDVAYFIRERSPWMEAYMYFPRSTWEASDRSPKTWPLVTWIPVLSDVLFKNKRVSNHPLAEVRSTLTAALDYSLFIFLARAKLPSYSTGSPFASKLEVITVFNFNICMAKFSYMRRSRSLIGAKAICMFVHRR